MKGPSSEIRALLLLIAAGCTEAFCSLPLNAETLRQGRDQRDQRRCRSLAELRVIRMAAGDISEQAAAAMREAAAAQDRATKLKKDFQASKTRKQESAEATRFQPAVVKDEEELMDADDIAREMSEMLSGLQQRGTGSKKDPLAGTKWAFELDFGREKGTWMDARWGASGLRVKRCLAIEFQPDGRVLPIQHSFGLRRKLDGVKEGKWVVDGKFPSEKVKFWVDHDGFTKEETGCDIDLPAGRLFLSANTMGGRLGKQGGMSIEQMRFYIRRERRMVGTYTPSKIE